jgi:hypothetical protein
LHQSLASRRFLNLIGSTSNRVVAMRGAVPMLEGNLLIYMPDLNEDDKKAIRYAVDYETWRKIRRNEQHLYFLGRETVIAALRKAGARACEPIEIACLAAADKLARDK